MDVAETFLRKGLLDERQVELARNAQSDGLRLDEVVVRLGFLKEETALRALGEEVGLEFVDLAEAEVDLSLLQDFPSRFIHREALFPVRQSNGTLVVATSDPFNLYPLDELSAATGLTVMPVLATRAEIAKLIKTHLGVGSETIDGLLAQTGDERIEFWTRRSRRRLRAFRDGPGAVGGAAGQRDSARGDRLAGERRPHRVAGRGLAASATASTACCTPSRCRRRSTAFRRPSSAA